MVRALHHCQLRELKECVEDKLKSKHINVILPDSANGLITTIRRYWDPLNFEFTRFVVLYLEVENLKMKMESYEQLVKKEVTVCLSECRARSIRPEPPPQCVNMSVKLEVDQYSYSLHEVLKAKPFLVDKLGVSTAIFAGFNPGSVVLFFYIPRDTVLTAAAQIPASLEVFRIVKMVNVKVEGHFSFDVLTGKASLHVCLCGYT